MSEFRSLVDGMFTVDAIGTPLVNKQVVQLQLNQGTKLKIVFYFCKSSCGFSIHVHVGEWINCVVRVSPYKRSILTTPFLLIGPSDLKGRVNVYISQSASSAPEVSPRRPYQRRTPPSASYDVKLPDITELNQPAISENEGMFGWVTDSQNNLKTIYFFIV